MTYTSGQDVMVDVFGIEHHGHVVSQSHGWVVCVIATDPLADYGSVGPKLSPRSTVCVPESRVRSLT